MNNVPDNLLFAASHEWVKVEADGTLTVGISDFAQEQLGELVFLEVPEVGRELNAAEACAVVESVKAASDVYSPVSGKVIAANTALSDDMGKVNTDPYNAWLFKLQPANKDELKELMNAEAYRNSFL
jgi:glycine cleavage system H protein